MIAKHALRTALLGCLLAGCSVQLLEDVGEVGDIGAPRPCSEPTKLFNTFSMRANRIAWKGDKGDPKAMLTLELVFTNEKGFPLALSNSGSGVLYTIQFKLQGEKGGSHVPKEATGVTLIREPKKFKEPQRRSVFAAPAPRPKNADGIDNTRDVNFRIKPGAPEEGKLVFQVPRDNYLLTVERKLDDKAASGMPTDHISVCKISGHDAAAIGPAGGPAIPGVH